MSASTPPIIDATLRLRDGRALGIASVGKNDGPPIFYFHGHGSSRLEVLLWAEFAARLGVRLIALDRPGIGRSDLKAGYRLLDWPADVMEVMLLARPWGFNLKEIAFEKIFLWHGEHDRFLPLSVAHALAQALPHCTATFYPQEGHLSMGNHAEDILRTLSS